MKEVNVKQARLLHHFDPQRTERSLGGALWRTLMSFLVAASASQHTVPTRKVSISYLLYFCDIA